MNQHDSQEDSNSSAYLEDDMRDKRVLEKVIYSLHEMAFKDILRAVKWDPNETLNPESKLEEGGALVGAFILGCCLIDAMACYCYNEDGTRETYEGFCKDYLPNEGENKYDAYALYYSLRCGLVHNYLPCNTKGNSSVNYKLTHNEVDKHLHSVPEDNKTIYLNLQNFVCDVKKAMDKFFKAIDEGRKVSKKVLARAKKMGWMEVSQKRIPNDLTQTFPPGIISAHTIAASGLNQQSNFLQPYPWLKSPGQ